MYAARRWHGVHLLLFWLAIIAGCGVVRWSVSAGVYRGSVESLVAVDRHGLWSPAFAATVTLVAATVAALILASATASWVAGRGERHAMRLAAKAGHRRVLM